MFTGLKTKGKGSRPDKTLIRINRVEGQVRAIKRMYQEGRDCSELVQQIKASRSALGKIASLVLKDEAKVCLEKGKIKRLDQVVEKAFGSL